MELHIMNSVNQSATAIQGSKLDLALAQNCQRFSHLPSSPCSLLFPTMEKITPFDIPLLNNEICQYLSRKELAHCVLVSKAWAGWFSPALWRDLDYRNETPDILI